MSLFETYKKVAASQPQNTGTIPKRSDSFLAEAAKQNTPSVRNTPAIPKRQEAYKIALEQQKLKVDPVSGKVIEQPTENKNMKKIIFIVVAVVVVAGIMYFIFRSKSKK